MAELRQLQGTPNILIVGSKSIYLSEEDYREKLRDYLYRQTAETSPVYKGSHDFWITYPTPALPGHSPNHSWEDRDAGERPLRGIVEMAEIPLRDGRDTMGDGYRAALRDEIAILLQEVGHHWLVPGDLKFETSSGDRTVTQVNDLVRALNRGQWPSTPPLLGRDSIHWSVFAQTEDSAFDGQSYKRSKDEHDRDLWAQEQAVHPTIRPRTDEGVGAVQMTSSYSDLDLFVMGVLKEEEVYPRQNGRFYWIEPRWTRPLEYMVGMFIEFDNDEYYYFGFHEHQDAISVNSTDGYYTRVNIPTRYYRVDDYGMVLRVVRRGNDFYFQARPDYRYTNPERDLVHHLFEELNFLPEVSAIAGWEDFKTISHREINATPRAIGLIVRKWEHPFLAEGRFFNFEIQDATGQHGWRFHDVPRMQTGRLDYSTLTEGNLFYHRPTGGPIARTVNNRLYINAPFSVLSSVSEGGVRHYPHFDIKGKTNDRAPRIVVRPAAGDFVFGSSVNVSRTIMTPWAGGSIVGKQMVGDSHSLRARNVIIPNTVRDKQPPPPDNSYKMAFIVVVDDADKVPDTFIEQLDLVRRYWDVAFHTATRRRRSSYSRLRRVAKS